MMIFFNDYFSPGDRRMCDCIGAIYSRAPTMADVNM